MALRHLWGCEFCRAFWLLKRDCYRVRVLPWGEQLPFLSPNTKLEWSREFWKVPSRLPCFKRSVSLAVAFFISGKWPILFADGRLPTIPILPSQRDSCVPSLVQGLLWVFAIFVRVSDPSGYTKLPDLRRTHTQLHQKAPWGEQVHQCTHRCSTWKSTLAIILLHCLILPHLTSNFCLASWHGIVFYPLIWPAAPSIFLETWLCWKRKSEYVFSTFPVAYVCTLMEHHIISLYHLLFIICC